MKRLLLLCWLFTSFKLFAQIDYTHCKKFIDTTNANFQKTGFAFPFVIDEKSGKLETINHHMSYSGEKAGEHVYTSSGWAGDLKISVKNKGDNNIGTIVLDSNSKASGQSQKVLTTFMFDIKNNKCIPKIAFSNFDANGEELQTTLFDMRLCKKLNDYFEKNKELEKCFDPKSKENEQMAALFEDSGYSVSNTVQKLGKYTAIMNRYSYSVEQKILTGSSKNFDLLSTNSDEENKKILGILGGSPLISGQMILNDCYERGFKSLLSDASVWENKFKNNTTEGGSVEPE